MKHKNRLNLLQSILEKEQDFVLVSKKQTNALQEIIKERPQVKLAKKLIEERKRLMMKHSQI